MNTDELIQQAMGSAGKLVGGPDLFVLEGNAELNEFRIKPVDETYKENLIAFAWEINTGYVFLEMYTTRKAKEETIGFIRTLMRYEEGKTLL